MSTTLVASTVRHLVDPVLAVVFPSNCPQCRATLDRPTRGPLCEPCWSRLPRHAGSVCACGVPLTETAAVCGRCRRGLSDFGRGFSMGPYAGGLRLLIHELKFHGRRRVATHVAEAIVADARCSGLLSEGSVLVPVPLHPRRRRERGFNQSEVLADAIGRRCGLRVASQALVRRKETVSQTGLSAAARRANVAGAFAVRRRTLVAGRVVVLVDDVLTTGATARACARALRQAGASEVRLLTLARVD